MPSAKYEIHLKKGKRAVLFSGFSKSFIGGGLVCQLCLAFVTPWTVAARLLCPWGSPGKNTGVGCHFLLQGVIRTQKLNPGLLHCRQILDQVRFQSEPDLVWENTNSFYFPLASFAEQLPGFCF